MSRAPTLRELLEQPLGAPAYWDADILSEICKSIPTKPLELEHVSLSWRSKITGLTYCERSQPEHDQAIFQSDDPVLVRGALRIKKLEWLSEDGRRVLEEELRERDTKERRARGAGAALSNLSLTTVFASKLKKRFRVWIQAKKPFPAVFMLSKQAPGVLWLKTEDRVRWFVVVSMSTETFKRSQTFLARYRLVHDMEELIKLSDSSGRPEPRRARTVEWFIKQYMNHKYEGSSSKQARAKAKRELRELIAAHCQWLLADQKLKKQERLFDLDVWKDWYQRWRRGYRPNDLSDDAMSVDSSRSPVGSDDDRMDVDDAPSPSTEQEPPPNAHKRVHSPDLAYHEYSSGLEYEDAPPPPPAQDYYRAYSESRSDSEPPADSDFTEDEPPQSGTDSDDSLVYPEVRTDPDVLAAIPPIMFADPRLPATGGKWYCPIPGCSHTIDFYNLRDDAPNIDEISVASRRRIQQGGWSWGDPNVVRSLVLLASAHYRDHLDRLGIEMRGTGMRVQFVWKHPSEHPSRHANASVAREAEAPSNTQVKVEASQ